MNLRLACVALLGLSVSLGTAAQGRPHVHGEAALDIVIETGRVTVQLETPLDGLLGFERAPRDAAEKRRVDAAVAALRGADALFRFTPAAGCAIASVELSSAALALGHPAPGEAQAGHADLDGTYVFKCADTARLTDVDVGLFNPFPGMHNIKVEVAASRGQFKRELTRPAQRVSLVR